ICCTPSLPGSSTKTRSPGCTPLSRSWMSGARESMKTTCWGVLAVTCLHSLLGVVEFNAVHLRPARHRSLPCKVFDYQAEHPPGSDWGRASTVARGRFAGVGTAGSRMTPLRTRLRCDGLARLRVAHRRAIPCQCDSEVRMGAAHHS